MKPTSLQAIANKAASDKVHRFQNLFGLLSIGYLLWCWRFVNKRAASGVDRKDARSYQENLQENIEGLVAAVKGGLVSGQAGAQKVYTQAQREAEALGYTGHRGQVASNWSIQAPGSDLRTGLSGVQLRLPAWRWRLRCDQRPGRGAEKRKLPLSGRADIRGFFDNIDHEKLIELMALRIDDKAFIRLIRKWLKAGILEPDGAVNLP